MSVEIAKSIDWLQLTWTGRKYPEQVLPIMPSFELMDKTNPPANYEKAWKLANGGLYCYSSDIRQGIMVTMSGEPLRRAREAGCNDEGMVNWAKSARNVPRLDYAIDQFGDNGEVKSPKEFFEAHSRGEIKTRLGLDRSHKDEKVENGRTYEWGSTKSDCRMVIYDKANEMKLLWKAWTRVEMRLRNEQAKALVRDMDVLGVSVAGDAKIKKVFKSDLGWFMDMINSKSVDLTKIPRKKSNFGKWLRETVIPSIAGHIESDTDEIESFITEIIKIYKGVDG